jgi:hypothetical protein
MKAVSDGKPKYLAEAPVAVAGVGAAVTDQCEGALVEFDGVDVVKDDFGLESLGMFLKALHQVGALHTVHVGGPVVHLGGGHQLASLGHAGDQQGFEVGAGGVDSGGVTGRAGA